MADTVVRPSEQSIQAAFAEAEKEAAFWRKHYDTYLAQYSDQFVTIAKADGQVVVSSASLDYLFGYLAGRGLDVKEVRVKFMAATPQHVML
jgi:hypothetical protein